MRFYHLLTGTFSKRYCSSSYIIFNEEQLEQFTRNYRHVIGSQNINSLSFVKHPFYRGANDWKVSFERTYTYVFALIVKYKNYVKPTLYIRDCTVSVST